MKKVEDFTTTECTEITEEIIPFFLCDLCALCGEHSFDLSLNPTRVESMDLAFSLKNLIASNDSVRYVFRPGGGSWM